MKTDYPVKMLCETLEVSSSGYYDWRKRQQEPCQREQADQRLVVEIRAICAQGRHTYGSPRVHAQLRQDGRRHGRKRVARLMKKDGLQGRARKRWKVMTTDSRHTEPIAPQRLLGATAPLESNQVWVGDITYIPTKEGWLYLAAIEDLYSRRIVGWATSKTLEATLVLKAWTMACTHRQTPAGLIFHSDRGVQYACQDFRQALKKVKCLASMSRRANCYDNAAMESFWSTLKLEMVYRREFQTHAQAQREIFDYIETFYNRSRLHSSLGYKSPMDFENQNN